MTHSIHQLIESGNAREMLDYVSGLEGITESQLIQRAMREYMKRHIVHLETCEGIIQVRNGEGVPDSELDAMFVEWDREDEAMESHRSEIMTPVAKKQKLRVG